MVMSIPSCLIASYQLRVASLDVTEARRSAASTHTRVFKHGCILTTSILLGCGGLLVRSLAVPLRLLVGSHARRFEATYLFVIRFAPSPVVP